MNYYISDPHKESYLLLFHGYGASGQDLLPLSYSLPVNIGVICLEGIFDVPYLAQGKCWFEISADLLGNRNPENWWSANAQKSVEVATQAIKDLQQKFVIAGIGGFSQGGVMALHLAHLIAHKPLFLMSTFLLGKDHLIVPESVIRQSHGTQDQVLPYSLGLRLNQFLQEKKLPIEFFDFVGGHEIPQNIVDKLFKIGVW